MATLYLLCGLPGSGKTTWARQVETTGALRLSLDEEVLTRLAGRRDPANAWRTSLEDLNEMQAVVIAEHRDRASQALAEGQSVLLDHGLWRRSDRESAKALAEGSGAHWRLLYFSIDPEEQWRRLDERNRGDLDLVHFISRHEMDLFASRFEPPEGEGEEAVNENAP